MKILKLGDLHFGVKQDDAWIQNIQSHAIDQAIEYSIKNNIKKWIQTGDWFDVRKAITHATMEFTRKQIEKIENAGIEVDVIVGNHDMHYKNTLTPNACTELLSQYKCITIYEKPTTVLYDNVYIDLIPWMCESNKTEILNHIKSSIAEYSVGHWELNGFWFYKGLKSHGIEPDFLSRYKIAWSGHFHTQSKSGNVHYIGTPYTLTAGDENDPRGFWEFDTVTQKSKFIENTVTWHKKIFYPCTDLKIEEFKNLSVRMIVEKVDANLTKIETELEKVVHELRLVSNIDNSLELAEGQEVDLTIKTLPELMDEYIEALPECTDDDKIAIKQYTKQLWVESTT